MPSRSLVNHTWQPSLEASVRLKAMSSILIVLVILDAGIQQVSDVSGSRHAIDGEESYLGLGEVLVILGVEDDMTC